MSSPSLVSVIVPCFNQGHFIDECLQSVFLQSYPNYEVIVVNDGSTDFFTNEKLKAITHPTVKVLWETNQGLSAARNNAIKASSGAYILPLDADDRIAPDYIRKAIEILEKESSVGLVYGKVEYFGLKKGIWEMDSFSMEKILLYNQIYSSAIYRKCDYDRTNGYDTGMTFGWEDWDFWLSILELGKSVYFINELCFYYRVRSNSMVQSMKDEHRIYLRRRVYQRHSNLYTNLFSDPLSLYEELQYFKNEFDSNWAGKLYRKVKWLLSKIR